MSGHTPGPWQVVAELRDTDEIICDMLNNGYVAITQGQKLANWRDDAALIAAAPELLEALEQVCRIWDHHCDAHGDGTPSEAHARVRAAIAKARGTPC